MEHNSESYIVVKEFTDKGKTTREVIAKGVTKQGFIDAYTEKGCVMRGGENPHFEDIYSGVVYKLENHFEQGGQVDRERDIEIAKTILMQLGGSNRLQIFTGAYNFVAVPNGVSFRIKNRSVNYVKIVLNAMDTYDIEFGLIRGTNYKIVKELSGIYNDQLVEIFTRYTGMVLRLKEGGAIQGEENAEMVMNQNLQIRHHTEELEEILKSGKEVPAWVVSKVSRAADSMSDATHYLEGTPNKMARGGNPRMVDISKLKVYVLTYVPVFDINQAMKIMQKAVYAESEEDAISQLPRKAKVLSVKLASGGSRGVVQQEGVRQPSLSQQIRNEIKALKEMLPLLKGKDKKQVQNEIENLKDILDEMRAEGQYAEGGGVYDSADGISPAKQKAFNSLQNEGYFEKEAIEYVGGIKEWNKLSATEKEIIISDIEKDWSKSTFFAEGGGVDEMAMGGQVSKEYEIIPNTTYQLKIQVYYDKGGMNYFSGGVNKRGYYLSVTPVQIEMQGNNVVIESYTAFSGIKKLILEVERQSPKSAEKAKELAESSIPELKQYVLNQMIERGEIPQDMPNPEPEPLPEPDFNIEQVKGEIEALKELLPFLEGDNKKVIEEQIDILSIVLMQNDNFDGGVGRSTITDLADFDPETTLVFDGDAYFEDFPEITHLGNLQEIKGFANFIRSKVRNLGNLQTIRGSAIFRNSQIQDLGNLQTIGGDANFTNSQLQSLGNLQTIRGKAYFGNRTDLQAEWKARQEAMNYEIQFIVRYEKLWDGESDNFTKVFKDKKQALNFAKEVYSSVDYEKLDTQGKTIDVGFVNVNNGELVSYKNKKYAQGGGVGNFPPKGELKNKENLLLKYEKIGSDYEFFVYKPEKKDVSFYEQIKYVCVNKDCPTRMSYNQFLNYLYAETYLDDRKYAKGGGVGTHIDLFEDYENMPPKIAKIFDKYSEDFEDGNYKGLSMALKEMQQLGYTFEYYLDGQAYGLRPIGVPLNQLKGYEDFEEDYAKGGEVFVCPVGTQIQSLIFDKSMFNLRQAKAWAKKNNFENDFVDGKLNTMRIRQKDPAMFTEDGFRTIQLRQGVQAVIGCPKKRTIRRKK